MGTRVIKNPGLSVAHRKKEELRALALIAGAIGVPLFLAFLLVAADMRSDLSDLKPIPSSADQAAILVGWGALEGPTAPILKKVRMLGYMMEGYPPSADGRPVEMFVMMPEAGHILHPAHRIPNQMVEVRPKHSTPFNFRTMVWVSGTLIPIVGHAKSGNATYAMTEATVEPATQSDITRWFTP